MNNEVESYVGELRELRKLKETLTKQNEELKYEININCESFPLLNALTRPWVLNYPQEVP